MTVLRSTSARPQTRADAVRARRRQREAQRALPATRTTRDLRAAVERAPLPAPRQRTSAVRTSRRRWNAAVAPAGGLRTLADVLPAVHVSWRLASAAMVMLLGSLLFHVLSTPEYFVNAINLAGARYVPGEEIYKASGVNHVHVFWLDPAEIKANVEKIPGIKSAYVEVSWPSNVYLEVTENEPVLAWSQGGQMVWVDRDGAVFPARGDIAGLLPIVVDDASNPLTNEARIPVAAIEGALQLKQLRSNIELLHYDSINGLSYQDGRGWRGYFGVGTAMEVKLAVYETLVANLLSRGIYPSMISVADKDAPYYRR